MSVFESVSDDTLFKIISETKNNVKTKKPNTEITYILPLFIEEEICIQGVDLPLITPPSSITPKNVSFLIKPLPFGDCKLSRSQKMCETLTIAHKKCFKVSQRFMRLLEIITNYKQEALFTHIREPFLKNNYKLPFKSYYDYYKVEDALISIERNPIPKALVKYLGVNLRAALSSSGIQLTNWSQNQIIIGNSQLEAYYFNKKIRLSEQRTQIRTSLRHARTCLVLATILQGFDLYIPNYMDVRGRMYPQFKLFSRTSGVIKHLLGEGTSKKITIPGLRSLLQAYYRGNAELSQEFEDYLKTLIFSKKTLTRQMFTFFDKKPINFSKTKNPLYFMLIHMELLAVKTEKKTAINIEIDQTASGVVFLAFLTRNKQLAMVSNVISYENSCPYTYCRENFESFYTNNMKKRSNKFLIFATENRKLHKYALMCFCYNQTHTGRLEDFIKT